MRIRHSRDELMETEVHSHGVLSLQEKLRSRDPDVLTYHNLDNMNMAIK